jgi:thrombospondin type 3 repeat protein/HYR domain-containing protein/galactose oxidase-like protein
MRLAGSHGLRSLLVALAALGSGLPSIPARAACPPETPVPITSGTGALGSPLVFSFRGEPPDRGSFFVLGATSENNSGTLGVGSWLRSLGDLDGDGRTEYLLDIPGTGPGGWGDEAANGCPAALTPPYPPLVLGLRQERQDYDGDEAWDVFEDLNHNGRLDPGEDRDGDGRLTPPFVSTPFGTFVPSCEGSFREDVDCDGHLDRINEDVNGNGQLDLGEDRDRDNRLDLGTEDRNNNLHLDDRPFPQPDDQIFQILPDGSSFLLPPTYPYGDFFPDPGGIIVASVTWSGSAYDFDAINTPTRSIDAADGRHYRVVDAAPLERLIPRVSAVRAGDAPRFGYRMRIEPLPLERIDDVGGMRTVPGQHEAVLSSGFDTGELFLEDIYAPDRFPSSVPVPAEGGFFTILSRYFPGFFPLQQSLTVVPVFSSPLASLLLDQAGRSARLRNILDRDEDRILLPFDPCPDAAPTILGPGIHVDSNADGLGDVCDPSHDPDALVNASWETRTDPDGPGARSGASAVYDRARGVTVLFGGSSDAVTWEYDGTSWSSVATSIAPPARSGHRMVYDGAHGRVLLFGGITPEGIRLNDLWQYAGGAWSRIETGIAPPPSGIVGAGLSEFALAYDEARRLLVLFHATGQTWVFDGTSWRIVPSPRTPLPRAGMQMAYDALRRVIVLEGGIRESGGPYEPPRLLNDTWEFDGAGWQQVDTRGDLAPSWSGAMAFDSARRRMVNFGGVLTTQIPGNPGSQTGPIIFYSSAATRLYDGLSWSLLPTRPTVAPQIDPAVTYDSGRQVLVVHGFGASGSDGEAQGITAELRLPEDSDSDGVRDPRDNCPVRPNADQADLDHDGSGDACDNCAQTPNPTQRDLDRDGSGDACDGDMDGDGVPNSDDACPASYVAGRPFDEILGGGGPDSDGDGTPDDCDRCPRDPRDDADGDGVCGEADNCPMSFNPHQEDSTSDGAGDACQPVLVIEGVLEDGGEELEVTASARDPDGDPLAGSIEFFALTQFVLRPLDLDEPSSWCDADVYPPGQRGEGIVYVAPQAGEHALGDLDSSAYCNDGLPDFVIAAGRCDDPGSRFEYALSFFALPQRICVGRFDPQDPFNPDPASLVDLIAIASDEAGLHLSLVGTTPALVIPFDHGLPERSALTGLLPGTTYRLAITVTDGSSSPLTAATTFTYQGEQVMVILDGGPRAAIATRPTVECDGPAGAAVILDGSGSHDAGPQPAGLAYEWYESFGTPAQRLLGTEAILSMVLPLGSHDLLLRVIDTDGLQDMAHAVVTVRDTTPPLVSCPSHSTLECTGPDGARVSLDVRASDACSREFRIETARPGGSNPSDPYPLGTTAVAVTAIDASGNAATCEASVTVNDTVAPTIALLSHPPVLWPPNHRLLPVQIAWQTQDTCDRSPIFALVGARSSEPDDANGDGDGRTSDDIAGAETGTPDTMILLRAERAASGPGRLYELSYRAMDASGNMATGLTVVTVPRDLGAGPEPLQLRVEPGSVQGTGRLYWNAVPGALAYDVVSGDLAEVSRGAEVTTARISRHIALSGDRTSFVESADAPTPPSGHAFFYLVQYRDERGESGYGTATALRPLEILLADD